MGGNASTRPGIKYDYRAGKKGLVLYLPAELHTRLKIESAIAGETMIEIGLAGLEAELLRREKRRAA